MLGEYVQPLPQLLQLSLVTENVGAFRGAVKGLEDMLETQISYKC